MSTHRGQNGKIVAAHSNWVTDSENKINVLTPVISVEEAFEAYISELGYDTDLESKPINISKPTTNIYH